MVDADAFCGVSAKDILKPEMVKSMAINPIVFAMANPDPEITYPAAVEARPDVIMATGRSDYPNQVNNVLGFPYIFRGTLDVQATDINEEMKMAAAHALAKLAKEDVPEDVKHAYGDKELTFGSEYIIPKPFDPRVLVWTASAVAEAAMLTGVAKKPVNIEDYKEQLRKKIDWSRQVMRKIFLKAKKDPKRIVFPEGTNPKIIWAAAEIAAKNQQNPSRALPYMERAYKLYSSDIEVAEKLGINYAMLNNFEGAIQILEPLYQANPANASIMRNLGIAYYNAGQTQLGLSLISQSDALNSKSTNP